MITIEKPNTVVTSGIRDTVSFGIKQEGLAHIFGVLRNQLYSDKILAVIREYSCNAVDAHTEAGKPTVPIEVSLPSRFTPLLKIRDFGLGLSDTDIHDIYAYYGESTKRKSNAMIGQLGLGSKSAFAYGDNFVITSFVNGVKSTYNAFIDASQIGQIAKLGSEPTDEPNGVEISISVRENDINTFHTKAFNLFRYFKVRPIVHGATFSFENKKAVMSGKDWVIYGDGAAAVAIMGNIGYPIDNHWTDANITSTLACGLEVDFSIGDLEISASREKLQYTDRTKQVIHDKLKSVVAEVSAELNAKFNTCATVFDAHKLYGTVMDFSSSLYSLRGMIKSSLMFKGKQINSSEMNVPSTMVGGFSVKTYVPRYRGNGDNLSSEEAYRIHCSDKTVIVENDLGISGGIVNRVYNLVKVDGKKVYVFSYSTPADRKTFMDGTGLEDSNVIKLSTLPKISLATVTGYVKNTKHSSKEFVYDFNFVPSSRYHRKHSDYWTTEQVDIANDSGIYVVLDGFCFRKQDGTWENPNHLKGIIESMKVFGISIPKIYGFKIIQEAQIKANTNMVSIWDYIATELTEYFNKNKIAQKVANRLAYDSNQNHRWLNFMRKYGKSVSSKTLFAKTAEIFEYMQHAKDKAILDEAVEWKQYFTTTLPAEHDLGKLADEIDAKYPLFGAIYYWDSNPVQAKATKDYIDLIDG